MIKALAFDVFGTVVDWRTSIAREAVAVFAKIGREDIDPARFADDWRGLYQPAMEECRSGRRAYTRLDLLNRETLDTLVERFDIAADEATLADLALARHGGLPWDAILGAEATGIYKPLPQAYLGTADILGIAPNELCLVAAHHSDLAAARACGLATAYVDRPMELGGAPKPDHAAEQVWDYSAASLTELADLIGC